LPGFSLSLVRAVQILASHLCFRTINLFTIGKESPSYDNDELFVNHVLRDDRDVFHTQATDTVVEFGVTILAQADTDG
jgi:hypothetical protein